MSSKAERLDDYGFTEYVWSLKLFLIDNRRGRVRLLVTLEGVGVRLSVTVEGEKLGYW